MFDSISVLIDCCGFNLIRLDETVQGRREKMIESIDWIPFGYCLRQHLLVA